MKLSAALFRNTLTTSVLSSVLLCNLAMAESHSEHKEHGAHEHGAARLTIATTDDGIEVSLESPAANVFGFEHIASSDDDHHTIHSAVKTLENGNEIFYATKAAGCELSSVEIESAQVEAHKHEKHGDEGHDHDHDDHEKEHVEKDKDAHDHDEKHEEHADHDHDEHDHESGSTHNDVDVTWNFKCESPKELERVDVRLFSKFLKGFEKISVDWISASKAGKVDLEADGMVLLTK